MNNTIDPGISLAYSQPVTIFLAVFAAFLIILTVGGNCLVLIAFFVEKSLRTPTNYLIESLAFTDLLIGLISMSLFTMYVLLGKWPLNKTICDLWLSMDYTACLTSQYTVFFITLDRFCSVKFPTSYREWRTKRIVINVIIGTWLIPAILFFTVIFGWPYFNKTIVREPDRCDPEFFLHFEFNITLTCVYFWFTLFVMLGLYVRIYCVARQLQKKSQKRRLLTSRTQFQNYQMYEMNLDSTNNQARNSNTNQIPERNDADENHLTVDPLNANNASEDTEESLNRKPNRFKTCRDSRKYHKKISSTNNYFHPHTGESRANFSKIQTENHSAPALGNTKDFDQNKRSAAKKYVPDSSESYYDDESSCSSYTQEKTNRQKSIIAPIAEAMTISARQKILIPNTPKDPTGGPSVTNNLEPNVVDQILPYRRDNKEVQGDPDVLFTKKNTNIICFKNFFCICECCFKRCTTKGFPLLSSRQRGHSENRAYKALRTITLIMGAFLICWTPYHILVMVRSFCENCVPDWVFNISYSLCYMNSPINPFCYALANVQIKKTLIRLLRCDFRRT